MSAKPLSQKEKKWIAELEALLASCPSKRLSAYTIGDKDISLYDKTVADSWEKANPTACLDASELHIRAGSFLGVIQFPFHIDSCAG